MLIRPSPAGKTEHRVAAVHESSESALFRTSDCTVLQLGAWRPTKAVDAANQMHVDSSPAEAHELPRISVDEHKPEFWLDYSFLNILSLLKGETERGV